MTSSFGSLSNGPSSCCIDPQEPGSHDHGGTPPGLRARRKCGQVSGRSRSCTPTPGRTSDERQSNYPRIGLRNPDRNGSNRGCVVAGRPRRICPLRRCRRRDHGICIVLHSGAIRPNVGTEIEMNRELSRARSVSDGGWLLTPACGFNLGLQSIQGLLARRVEELQATVHPRSGRLSLAPRSFLPTCPRFLNQQIAMGYAGRGTPAIRPAR